MKEKLIDFAQFFAGNYNITEEGEIYPDNKYDPVTTDEVVEAYLKSIKL